MGPVTSTSRTPMAVGAEKSTFAFRAGVTVSAAAAMSPSPATSRERSWSRGTGMAMQCTVTTFLPSLSLRCFSNASIVS